MANELHAVKEVVVQVGREMLRSGLVVGTWGNVSARVPGGFVITPSGKGYLETEASDLVVMDLEGKVLQGSKPSSEYHLHLHIYRARADIQAVVHTHSIYASAHAAARVPIPVSIEDLAMVNGGAVEVAEYALPGTEDLARNAVRALKERWAVLLANHGVAGGGRSVREAMLACQMVEKSAQINLMARSLGQPFELDREDVELMRRNYLASYGQSQIV